MTNFTNNLAGFPDWIFQSLLYDPGNLLFFTGAFFMVFFLLFFLTYILLGQTPRLRAAVILLFSLWFYYKCSGVFVLVILLSGTLNYLIAMAMGAAEKPRRQTMLLFAGILVNLAMLVLFKYTPWFSKISELFASGRWTFEALAFPMGLSFYTFANLSYLIDVKKQALIPEGSYVKYMTYISFFPIVQMGPIERAKNFLPQLSLPFRLSREDVAAGFYLILSGALKKMVIGDYVNLHLVSQVFSTPERYTGMENLAAILGYSLVIYCDFSGYTDMARGIARWMGFNIQVNFNFPYQSESIGEFWRRWHISLSNWLRDYIFLPLAFRLSGLIKQEHLFSRRYLRTDIVIFNITALVTFTLCGLWHGIGWNFLIWGLMHGFALAVQKSWSHATRRLKRGMGAPLRKINRMAGIILTFSFVSGAWVFFRMHIPEESFAVFAQITGNFYPQGFLTFLSAYYPVLLMITIGYVLHFLPGSLYSNLQKMLVPLGWPWKVLISIAVITLIVYFKGLGSAMPIYIQF
ncbi:MAG: MBOAT family protein [Bacteroidetes bacterium]|nr:MBOAT family protein [Bacteroidota bacterium]